VFVTYKPLQLSGK